MSNITKNQLTQITPFSDFRALCQGQQPLHSGDGHASTGFTLSIVVVVIVQLADAAVRISSSHLVSAVSQVSVCGIEVARVGTTYIPDLT